jgi:hypothetical protein
LNPNGLGAVVRPVIKGVENDLFVDEPLLL